MIPIDPLAMMLGSLSLLVSLVCVAALLALLVACLNVRSRWFIRAHPWWFGLLAVFLANGSLPAVEFLRWQASHWFEQRALSPRLDSEQALGELLLPAGTRVWLKRLEPGRSLGGKPLPHGLQSLQRAEFDRQPAVIQGATVRRLILDDTFAEVSLVDDAQLAGWQCSAQAPVTFRYVDGARFAPEQWQLEGCTLAAGSQVAGITWPGPMTVRAVEDGRWQLETTDIPVRFQGMTLRLWNLWLDGPYGALLDWQAELTETVEFGPMQYPATTRVRALHGNLLFSPLVEAPGVERSSGKPIEPDLSVEQDAVGQVLGTHRNGDVGVVDWLKVVP
ncbi:hypothetical protein BVH03_01670 [Pseudomonas sp. PA15(2017)]|uniref:hypothetical protein n=1 Tax=Pseudomonas sp. PA15(2017) TaxID=1932111 RepID=UPI00095BC6E6|nr:hypothetical protein [Pseudomonas sp. PA15(2017)]OLU34863.1 hypothetical protein BVH03_01670 [Pseudomonas sp. PA15(2017)]